MCRERERNLPTPDEFLLAKLKKIPHHIRVAFFTAAASTFFVHLFFFVGRFANEDDQHYVRYSTWHIRSGRWADAVRITGDYISPIVLFFCFIIALSLTVCIIIYLLRIRHTVNCVLIAAALPAFPCLAVGNGYLFMVEVYSVSMLFAALAVFVTERYRFGWIAGAVLLAVSIGEYQSYLALAMTLCLISVLMELLLNRLKKTELFHLFLRYLLMGVAGIACYFAALHTLLHFSGQELLSYKGINTMGKIPLSQLPALVFRTYKNFFNFFFGKRFLSAGHLLVLAFILLFLLCVGSLIVVIVRRKIYRKPTELLIIVISLLALPVCANIVDFVAFQSSASVLNIFAFSMVLPLACGLSELSICLLPNTFLARAGRALTSWGLLAAMIIVGWSWFQQTNIYYNKISSYYEHTMLMYNRVFSRIEVLPEFSQGASVAFINDRNTNYYDFSGATDYSDVFLEDPGLWNPLIGLSQIPKPTRMISSILGVEINRVESSHLQDLKDTDEYKAMPAWPMDGSVAVIDGVIVVNLNSFDAAVKLHNDTIVFDINVHPGALDQSDATYAWYIYKDGVKIDTRWYEEGSEYIYLPEESGDYYGMLFMKNGKSMVTATTPTITIP